MDLYSRPPGLDATRRAKVADAGARLPVDVDGYLGLCERAAATARGDGAPVFVAWRQKCGAIDPAELLDVAFAKSSRAFFWSSPSDGASFVAAGSACDLVGRGTTRFGQVRHARRQALSRMLHGGLPGGDTARTPSFVGGFSFDVAQGDGSSPLPDALMWLPSVVVGRDDDDCTLTLHARVGPDDRIDRADAANAIARLVAALAATGGRTDDRRSDPGHVSMVDRPDSREWAALVDAAQHRVRREKLDGIAVSRQLELISSRRFDVASALRFLARRDPAVTVFGCRVGDGAFLGATPQRLAGLRRGKVRATSLTGTTARGETSE
ncbi:MAG: chorismate-binding protein, partial [Stackebrandtia sp.]